MGIKCMNLAIGEEGQYQAGGDHRFFQPCSLEEIMSHPID